MSLPSHQQQREQEAWRDVGRTAVSRGSAWTLALVFLVLLFSVPLHQLLHEGLQARAQGEPFRPTSLFLVRNAPGILAELREGRFRPRGFIAANRLFLRLLDEQEDLLEDESLLGQAVRPAMQAFFSSRLGVGNEQAYPGRGRWLFYRPDLEYLTGPGFLEARQLAGRAASGSEWQAAPQPDPRRAILDFKEQLDARGIDLVLAPTPVKPSLHPERFSRRMDGAAQPLQNVSYAGFLRDLEAAGVEVFDPAGLLNERAREKGIFQYLATDTHWTPEAMEAVAARLAGLLRSRLGPPPATFEPLQRRETAWSGQGDLARMLELPDGQTVFPQEEVVLRQVLTADGQYWRPSEDAEVLVLGDSFSNIYSLDPMGWGESAGWTEQLSYHLGRPLDRLTRNDGGAFATRGMLSRELAQGRDRLAGKRVVVWQFAARELASGDWRILSIDLGDPPQRSFFVPPPGTSKLVRGAVRAVSPAPRPGTVPYRDHVVSVHLVDLPDNGEALVYLLSMTDNEWTRAARLRPGEEITLRLRPWSDVAGLYESLNRSELDDFELQLEEPCWGEWE